MIDMDLLNFFQPYINKYWTPNNIYVSVFCCLWAIFFWKIYLLYRQYRVYINNEEVPSELEKYLTQETMKKSRLYNIDRSRFNFIYQTWYQILSSIILYYNLLSYAWDISDKILQHYGYYNSEILQSIVFIFLFSIFQVIMDLPWSIYDSFVIEEAHGFNKYTLKFFLKDKLVKIAVMQAISLPLISASIYIIKIGGQYFFLYLWAFCSIVIFVLTTIYPGYIAPLFDKYVPLPESQIKKKIEDLAKSLNYPLKNIYIVEGSKRSSHSNAYLYGLFKSKTIVLFDTLIDKSVYDVSQLFEKKDKKSDLKEENVDSKEDKNDSKEENISSEKDEKINDIDSKEEKDEKDSKDKKPEGCSEDEILAVLAHELGHWKLNHIVKNLIISEVNMFLVFCVFGFLFQNNEIYAAFGFLTQKPIIIGLNLIFEYIFLLYNEVANFLLTCLSRKFEFQADAFGKKLNKAEELKKALIKLNNSNLSFPLNDWLYSAYNHSHPPLLERLTALSKTE